MQPLPTLPDDGLTTPIVGDWSEEKYQLVHCYSDIFSTSMKKKWESRVYLDLFSGAGRARIRGTNRIVPAIPLLVTSLRFPFTHYIFCEINRERIDALEKRLGRTSPKAVVSLVCGESNSNLEEIMSRVPMAERGKRVLTFCLADPYRLADLRFETIAKISADRFVDFLILIPSGMDASRNQDLYLRAKSRGLDAFLGHSDWRISWTAAERAGQRFADFVVDQFGLSMRKLGYKYNGLENAHLMTSTARRLPLYHLVMFSRHSLASDFWEKCKASTQPQRELF